MDNWNVWKFVSFQRWFQSWKRSGGERSGEYGGWNNSVMWCWTRNLFTYVAVWGRELSYKRHYLHNTAASSAIIWMDKQRSYNNNCRTLATFVVILLVIGLPQRCLSFKLSRHSRKRSNHRNTVLRETASSSYTFRGFP